MEMREQDDSFVDEQAVEREFRDIPLWVAKDYIRVLPESIETSDGFTGPGWRIELTELSPVRLGGLNFRRMLFRLFGNPDSVQRVWNQLEHKFYRGGA